MMFKTAARSVALLITTLSFIAPAAGQTDTAAQIDTKEFSDRLADITRGRTSADRMAAVAKLLDAMDVEYQLEPFEHKSKSGKNLIVDLSTEHENQILIGAHFDQVKVGQGAVDNACGCGLLIELIERFKKTPHTNHNLRFVFFDLEEEGLYGSQAYVAAYKDDAAPAYFINADIFGYGDAIWIMSDEPESPLPSAFVSACKEASFKVQVSPNKVYPPADHVPFLKAGIPTIAIALIAEPEIELVKGLLQGKRGKMPPILKTIHTPDDTVEKVKVTECVKAMPLVEAAIRKLDSE